MDQNSDESHIEWRDYKQSLFQHTRLARKGLGKIIIDLSRYSSPLIVHDPGTPQALNRPDGR